MNLDELIIYLKEISTNEEVQGLASIMRQWKANESDVLELRDLVERYLENIWIDDINLFNKIYERWSIFRDNAVDGIRGMTMNERLYWFGLMELFDNTKSDSVRNNIYKKLLASP
ncbi:hypothetical protein [Flagellimonas beolgyonensis]|uniref:hypothetical protein n=2 Tax=Flavobacteriaceae TaxID=49546 RepID=UPI003D65E120